MGDIKSDKFFVKFTFAIFTAFICLTAAAESLNRTNLLQYQAADGSVHAVTSKRDWEKRRGEILLAMQKVMGPLPGKEKHCPLDVKVDEVKDCGTYMLQTITYQSEPGSRVPAFLLIPKMAQEKKAHLPAMLVLHPTDPIGYKTILGLGKPNRAYGSELAERGYVVLAPSYPLLGKYQPDWRALGYQSGTMKAIWDNMRGIDLLESLPYVQHGKLGAIGHSLGGHNSIYTAVLDPRIKVAVSSCGFDSYQEYMNGDIRGWASERYMPKLLDYPLAQIPFDFYEMIGALAPRPLFVNAPSGDANFKWQSVDRILGAAKPVYHLWNAEEKIQVVHPDCPHDFPDEVRMKAYQFLDEILK